MYCGPTREAWKQAADLSARRHIVWLDRPFERVLAVMPQMYSDLWTGAKGMYKVEPAVADGGEVVIYAPHISEVSRVHGHLICGEIGYHCRDYFAKAMGSFSRIIPAAFSAHSTQPEGQGILRRRVWRHRASASRLQPPLSRKNAARRINLGYMDPASGDVEANGCCKRGLVGGPHAGETNSTACADWLPRSSRCRKNPEYFAL